MTLQFDNPNSHNELLAVLDAEERAILEHDLFHTHPETNMMTSVFVHTGDSLIIEALSPTTPTDEEVIPPPSIPCTIDHAPARITASSSNAMFQPSLHVGLTTRVPSPDLALFGPRDFWDHSIQSPTMPLTMPHDDSASNESNNDFTAPDVYRDDFYRVGEGVYGDYQPNTYTSPDTRSLMNDGSFAPDQSSSGRHIHSNGDIADILLVGVARWTSTEGYPDCSVHDRTHPSKRKGRKFTTNSPSKLTCAQSDSSREPRFAPELVRLASTSNVATTAGQQGDDAVNNMAPSETTLGKMRAESEQEPDDDAEHVKRMRYDSYGGGAISAGETYHIDPASLDFDANDNSPGAFTNNDASSSALATMLENQDSPDHSAEDWVLTMTSPYELGGDPFEDQSGPESLGPSFGLNEMAVLSATVLGKRRAETKWEDDDFAQVKHARYNRSTDGPSITETEQASIEAQFDIETLLAFINSNAVEIGDSPGASSADYTDYGALFNIVPLTPTTQNDVEDIADDAAEDAVHDAVDAAAEDATDDNVDDAGPVLMSQYELGVDLAETLQAPGRDSQVILFAACTKCHDDKARLYGRRTLHRPWTSAELAGSLPEPF
ncbi:hypothetical protein OBBRIDRAFT_804963 [Obba rivulosa]|uniref:Uncharacterized protein n=1 Tax=Obba rivulosa TaxID=1052685 RepID=A0A8E2DN61_9APHY|nr:hypothetical protein OBBRIDRAFT_804963 [Obba rivulosa]